MAASGILLLTDPELHAAVAARGRRTVAENVLRGPDRAALRGLLQGAASVKFAPDYVACVLNENFEDAKAQFLAPLMAIHYAHLVMLAEQGIVSPADAARASPRRSTPIDLDEVRQVQYDGTYEDLFFYVERLIVGACGEDAAGRLHTARSRNDIDMTMYRMQQREMMLALVDGDARAAAGAARSRGAAHREDVFRRAHPHAAGAADDDRALPAGGRRAARARRRPAARRLRQHQPESARRVRDHRHRLSRSIAAGRRRCSGSTARPATPTAASRPSTTCSRASRPRRCCSSGSAAWSRTCCCGARASSATCGWRTASCSAAASCRRSAIPVALEHARAIASKALGQATARSCSPSTTRRSATSSTPRTICSRSSSSMFSDARPRRPPRRGGDVRRASSTASGWRSARPQGWITVTELADTLAREHGVPFKAGHAIAARLVAAGAAQPGAGRCRTCCARCRWRCSGRRVEYRRRARWREC